jgi:predicted nucleotidyltransferase component of viral defense system
MQSDKRFARQVAARTGLGVKFVAKDSVLSGALKGLEGLLDETYVMKGGTAIGRAGYLDTPRFSEDVDLDVYSDLDLHELGRRFSRLLEGLEDFELSPPRYRGLGLRIDAHFNNTFGDRDRIRLELSPRPANWLDGVEVMETLLQSPFTMGEASLIKCYTRGALFARKVHALSGRYDGKDPFDLRGLWRGGIDPNDAMIAFVRYGRNEGLSVSDMMESADDNLRRMTSDIKAVASSTNHYIPRSSRPEWGVLLEDARTIVTFIREGI